MQSYLHNRKQSIFVDGIYGGEFFINIGVGQGTILGTTLFKVYIMDLHLHTLLFCVKFADDSSFEASGRTRDEVEQLVNSELIKISNWFKDNRLTLHPNKSRYIVHSRDKLISLRLDNTSIMRCGYGLQEESVKLLGLMIDENLDWSLQINNVKKKIAKGSYLLWRHRRKLNLAEKRTIYESFVRCHLLYCLTVWGGATKIILKPLESALKRCWKNMGPRKQHTLNRLQSLNILKLEDELEIQEAKFIWRWDKFKVPLSTRPLLSERIDNLRNRRFNRPRNSPTNSIETRLSQRATSSISALSKFKTKRTLARNLKKNIIGTKYQFRCRRRGCYICTR